EVLVDGKRVLNLSSNNYLGLTTHRRLKSAMVTAAEQWGAGSGAVRTIAGTMTVHEDLERRLAEFKHTEASLVFQSGFTANLGVLQSLVRQGDVIISDELNHASIIDGIRLSKAERSIFKHRDRVDLQIGTLSKAMGVLGGYVAAPQAVRDFLIHRARPFLFSTSHPPGVAAACIAAIEVLLAEPERIERLWKNTARFKDGLKRIGF